MFVRWKRKYRWLSPCGVDVLLYKSVKFYKIFLKLDFQLKRGKLSISYLGCLSNHGRKSFLYIFLSFTKAACVFTVSMQY